jgi:hypothetical protein
MHDEKLKVHYGARAVMATITYVHHLWTLQASFGPSTFVPPNSVRDVSSLLSSNAHTEKVAPQEEPHPVRL